MEQLINYEDVKTITVEEYFNNDIYSTDIFRNKYMQSYEKYPAEVFWRIASFLASQEETKEKEKYYTENWFSLMWNNWFRPGGSIIKGLGAETTISLANCTTIPLKYDTLESIHKCEYNLVKCSAFRQGSGFDSSNLRPKGCKINNAAEISDGVIPWIKKITHSANYVAQKNRRPAILVSLKVSHPDIYDFVVSKTRLGEIENANISVQIDDAFMEAVKLDDDWKLYFKTPHEEITKWVKAKEIFDLIAKTACDSAEPGVQFIDRMRERSMVHQIYQDTGDDKYKIISTNACSEKNLSAFSVCNLLSINFEKFSIDPQKYKKELEYLIPFIVRLADNVVSYELNNNLSPVPEQKEILKELREIGLGFTNLHAWLLKQNIQYDSNEAIEKTEKFISYYAYQIFKNSVNLGKEKGNAPGWDKVKNKDVFLNSRYYKNIINEFYDGNNDIKYMRNLAHLSIAPVGSISSIFSVPCLSSGIEPVFSPYYWRKTRALSITEYDYYFIIPEKIKKYLLQFIDNKEDYKKLKEFPGSIKDNDGKIGNELISIIYKYISSDFIKPSHEINPFQKIKLMSKVYKWIDASISCTFNLPENVTEEKIKDIYLNAYEYGLNAVSVYREGSRESILITEDPVTHEKNFNIKQIINQKRPEDIVYNFAPKRPKELPCKIYHCSVKGEKWLVFIGIYKGKPYEIFAGEQEDIYIPKSCTEGIIKKQKSGKYSLLIKIRNSDVEYKDIAHILMNAEQRALTRQLSLNLRHGIYPEFIVEQMKKSNGDITDFSSVVSRILSKYIKNFKKSEKCPECGESLVPMEGCLKCVSCLFSKCE